MTESTPDINFDVLITSPPAFDYSDLGTMKDQYKPLTETIGRDTMTETILDTDSRIASARRVYLCNHAPSRCKKCGATQLQLKDWLSNIYNSTWKCRECRYEWVQHNDYSELIAEHMEAEQEIVRLQEVTARLQEVILHLHSESGSSCDEATSVLPEKVAADIIYRMLSADPEMGNVESVPVEITDKMVDLLTGLRYKENNEVYRLKRKIQDAILEFTSESEPRPYSPAELILTIEEICNIA